MKGTTIGTVTDATGHYFLKNLPEGNFILEVSSVGYKTVTRNVTLKKGKTLEEDFEIEEDAIALDGVVVSANRSETTRRMAPTLVNVVDLKLFETTNSSTLSQGLNFQPGAFTFYGIRSDLTAKFGDNSLRYGESQSGSFFIFIQFHEALLRK